MADKIILFNTNIIVEGFAGGGNSNSFQRKYTWHVLATNVISPGFPRGEQGETEVNITFLIGTPSELTLTTMTLWLSLCNISIGISSES